MSTQRAYHIPATPTVQLPAKGSLLHFYVILYYEADSMFFFPPFVIMV